MKSKNLSNLYLFCLSVRYGGYIAASKVTEMSASSLSRAVSQLEESLGEKLLHRSAKQFSLTTEGDKCFQQFNSLFDSIEDKWIEQSNSKNMLVGDIKVSCPEPFADNFLNEIALEFMKINPGVNIHISFATKANNFFQMKTDLAVCTVLPDTPELVQKKLISTRFVLVASPIYLKLNGTPKHLNDLQHHHLLASNDTPYWEFEILGKTVKFPFNPHFKIDSPRTIIKAAYTGLGISLVPEVTIQNLVAEGKLKILLPELKAKKGELFLIWADHRLIPRRVREFKGMIIKRLDIHEFLSAISIES